MLNSKQKILKKVSFSTIFLLLALITFFLLPSFADTLEVKQLSYNTYWDNDPAINDSRDVVWLGRNDTKTTSVYFFSDSLGETVEISDFGSLSDPQINSRGDILWAGPFNNILSLLFYDSESDNISVIAGDFDGNGEDEIGFIRQQKNLNGHAKVKHDNKDKDDDDVDKPKVNHHQRIVIYEAPKVVDEKVL